MTNEMLLGQIVACMYQDDLPDLTEPANYRASIVLDQDPGLLASELVDQALEDYDMFPRWCAFVFAGRECPGERPPSIEVYAWDFFDSERDARWHAAEWIGDRPMLVPLREMPDGLLEHITVEVGGRAYLEPWTVTSRFCADHLR
jgi:hypothetical protein